MIPTSPPPSFGTVSGLDAPAAWQLIVATARSRGFKVYTYSQDLVVVSHSMALGRPNLSRPKLVIDILPMTNATTTVRARMVDRGRGLWRWWWAGVAAAGIGDLSVWGATTTRLVHAAHPVALNLLLIPAAMAAGGAVLMTVINGQVNEMKQELTALFQSVSTLLQMPQGH